MRGNETEDLTARLIGLRDILRNEIAAGQALATARMDGMDSARQQYLDGLADQRNALHDRIETVRQLARGEHQALEEQLNRRLDSLQLQLEQRFNATRDAVHDLRSLLDERYATQTKALDAAFKAAEQAVAVALANAEKATVKAEDASEKRFEGVNEFRKALSDQTSTFIPRAEYDTAHASLADRVTANADRLAALELRLTSRLDRGEGSEAGAAGLRSERRLDTGQAVAIVVALVVTIGLVVSVITLIVHK